MLYLQAEFVQCLHRRSSEETPKVFIAHTGPVQFIMLSRLSLTDTGQRLVFKLL